MDNQGNVQGNVTVPLAHLARNRHAVLAVGDRAHNPVLQPHPVEAIAPSAGVDQQAAVIAAVVATAQAAVK